MLTMPRRAEMLELVFYGGMNWTHHFLRGALLFLTNAQTMSGNV